MVMLHIKLKGMMNAATCKSIFCPYMHPRSKGQNNFCLNVPCHRALLFVELSANVVDRLLILICMIPKLQLGVGEMRFMFCDLHFSLK